MPCFRGDWPSPKRIQVSSHVPFTVPGRCQKWFLKLGLFRNQFWFISLRNSLAWKALECLLKNPVLIAKNGGSYEVLTMAPLCHPCAIYPKLVNDQPGAAWCFMLFFMCRGATYCLFHLEIIPIFSSLSSLNPPPVIDAQNVYTLFDGDK